MDGWVGEWKEDGWTDGLVEGRKKQWMDGWLKS